MQENHGDWLFLSPLSRTLTSDDSALRTFSFYISQFIFKCLGREYPLGQLDLTSLWINSTANAKNKQKNERDDSTVRATWRITVPEQQPHFGGELILRL